MNLRKLLISLVAAALVLPLGVQAATEHVNLDRAPIDPRDNASLQRGAKVFVNYCLNCHNAAFMRFNRLRDIDLTEQQIRENLVLTGAKVGDLMKVSIDARESKEWFGVTPPDLTVIARSRSSPSGSGADWLYTYLRSFYRDASRPTGWNNAIYPNVAMPHVMWELQGHQVMKEETVQGPGYPVTEHKLVLDRPGTLSPVEYDRLTADLVNYMSFMSEPVRLSREKIGIFVLFGLSILFILAYLLKKEYWKDVH